MRMSAPLFILLCALLHATGCSDYPRDAAGSLARAHDDAIRVGLSHDPPFVDLSAGAPSGIEVAWFDAFARARGMRVEWVEGNHERLMHDLVALRLHAVAGGHMPSSPWREVSWSLPFHVATEAGMIERRFALPPTESAWQLAIDRRLRDAPPGAAPARAP